MSSSEWITNRPPTEADGDADGSVRMIHAPDADPDDYVLVYWSYVAIGAPWQHTSCWEPPTEPEPTEPDHASTASTEPDRIAALEQRVAELKRGEDAASLFIPHFQSRLEKLEGLQADGSAPRWTLDRIAALERQLAERDRAQSVLTTALVKRLSALEGVAPDGRRPVKVPGGLSALEKRLETLETLFWAHKHEAHPGSIPFIPQP